jgi:glycerate 2-kinase
VRNAREALRALFAATMGELDVGRALEAVRPDVERFVGDAPGDLRLVAFGKAAVPMAVWLFSLYPGEEVRGVVSAPGRPPAARAARAGVEYFSAGHPVPNADSLRAAEAALGIVRGIAGPVRVLYLISGGGSALFELPIRDEIGLDALQRLNEVLVSCGADIVDVNVVRKHLSAVKGGRLALAASPARQLTVYISDVPAGHEASVASGPTMPDPSTLDDFRRVVSDYRLEGGLPAGVRRILRDPSLPETPKPGDPCFADSEWICALDNARAVGAARDFAQSRGWRTEWDDSVDDMEVGAAADRLLDRLRRLRQSAGAAVACVVSGGELSSPVRGRGIGGRNQAFVLGCVERIAGEPIAVLSAGTDGVDGNSPAAGAVADGTTLDRARAVGMEPANYRARSDSYSFFRELGDDVTCGATGNNVRDLRVLVSW